MKHAKLPRCPPGGVAEITRAELQTLRSIGRLFCAGAGGRQAYSPHRSAVIYTIIESCKRRGLEPYAYLKDVLTRLPGMTNHQIKDITPAAIAAANKQTVLKAAS